MRLAAFCGAAIAALILVSPATAASQRDWEACRDVGNAAAADTSIAACDRILADPKETAGNRAAAFGHRCGRWTTKGEADRAIADCSQAIALGAKRAADLRNRGAAHVLKQDYERALADFSEAIRLDAQDAAAHLGRGKTYLARGKAYFANRDYERALADYDRVIADYDQARALAERQWKEAMAAADRSARTAAYFNEAKRLSDVGYEAGVGSLRTGLDRMEVHKRALNAKSHVEARQRLERYRKDIGSDGDENSVLAGAVFHRLDLSVFFDARAYGLASDAEAIDSSLTIVQRAMQTSAGRALGALAVRFSAGTDDLAQLVRKSQDLTTEIDRLYIVWNDLSRASSKADAAERQRISRRIETISNERFRLWDMFKTKFPDYHALSNPKPLRLAEIQPLLADDEALVLVAGGYVWAVTKSAADWRRDELGVDQLKQLVSALRGTLDFRSDRPFDPAASFALYRGVLGPVDHIIRTKPRLSLVFEGALTSLPPQLLVTADPAGKALADVDWLIRRHAVTVLPAVASLKALRGKAARVAAPKPLIGFADPLFDPAGLPSNPRLATTVSVARGMGGAVADVKELAAALVPLPSTADELRQVAAGVKASASDIFLGRAASKSALKQAKLDQYRIVYFATHALVADEVERYAKLKAEPALVLSLPEKPSEHDDGLLTASEVAQLKLNADWVVLSASNTASGAKPCAEALSGLARAFFYAGGRSLLVSHWEVETESAVALMVGTFAAIAADPKLSHGQALQRSILAMLGDPRHPQWADPRYWAPFVVVGEPARPPR
jgi:CHAT domain-containing protein